ncbi:MAG: type II secretion system major pseudopilin GspG [Planctomycetes bacterium]|nr:type II secretion system major pseudopilin GspG [Planctomycetota bacterium]
MVVIVIIGLLSGLIAPNVIQYIARAKVAKAKAQIANFSSAVRNYYIDTDEYPQSLEDLVSQPSGVTGWNSEGYLLDLNEVPLDPWQNDYDYRIPGASGPFEIISYGKDGQEGGADDDADINSSELNKTAEPGGPGH